MSICSKMTPAISPFSDSIPRSICLLRPSTMSLFSNQHPISTAQINRARALIMSLIILCLAATSAIAQMPGDAAKIQQLLKETQPGINERPEDILPKVSQGIRLSEQLDNQQFKVQFYLNGAQAANRLKDLDLCSRFMQQALTATRNLEDPARLGDIKRVEAEIYLERHDYHRAQESLLSAVSSYKAAKHAPEIVRNLLKLAETSAVLGNNTEARLHAEEALARATGLGDLDLIGMSHQCLGKLPLIFNRATHASTRQAVESIISENDQAESHTLPKEASSLALEHLETAISHFRQTENRWGMANCLVLKGDTMAALTRGAQAIAYYQEAIEMYQQQSLPTILPIKLADLLLKLQKTSEARAILDEYTKSMPNTILPWYRLFEAYLEQNSGNTPKAVAVLNRGIQESTSLKDPYALKSLFLFRSQLEKTLGNFESALNALEQARYFETETARIAELTLPPLKTPTIPAGATDEDVRYERNRNVFLESKLYDFQYQTSITWIIGIAIALCSLIILLLKSESERKLKAELEEVELSVAQLERKLSQTQTDRDTIFKDLAQELRTPMSGIIGAVPIFRDTTLSKLQENCVNIVDISSRSILTLINDISDFSNLEEGKVQLAEEPMDLVMLTETVAQLFDNDSSYTDIKLVCEVPSDPLPLLTGDTTRIQQILLTLVSRSFQTTRGDFVMLRLEKLVPKSARDFRVRFCVEDSNSIADTEKLHEIFHPKPTLTDATSLHRPASMMGMAIVKKLVDTMHGSIEVETSPLGGISIVVILPFVLQPDEDAWEVPNPYERFPRKRVLIADQNKHSRNALCNHLRTWGLDMEQVESFEEIIPMLEAKMHFDLIAFDTTDAGSSLTNLEKVSAIRSCDSSKETPLILISHFSELNRPSEMKRQRNVHMITAPIQVRQLHAVVRQAILHKTSSNQSYARLTPTSPKLDRQSEVDTNIDPENGFHFVPYILPFRSEQRINPKLRILLAEDNLVNQKVTTLLLKKIGFVIDVASNGKEAVEQVAQGCYDVVFMDKVMPVLDGIGATRQIRKLESIAQPIIIALTASASMDDEIACRKATMDNFLAKPVQLEKMKAALAFATTALEQREKSEQKADPLLDKC
jgi:CheY-like chemotaxis protein/tetratricopeptide (TPR) repeat protein